LVRTTEPVTAPLLAEYVNVALNRAAAAQPVKFTVMLTALVCAGPRLPTVSGNAVFTIGVHAAPAVCVRVKVVILTPIADPGPLFRSDSVQTLAFGGPAFAVMFPAIVVG
jgi:hypothetical protein